MPSHTPPLAWPPTGGKVNRRLTKRLPSIRRVSFIGVSCLGVCDAERQKSKNPKKKKKLFMSLLGLERSWTDSFRNPKRTFPESLADWDLTKMMHSMKVP